MLNLFLDFLPTIHVWGDPEEQKNVFERHDINNLHS